MDGVFAKASTVGYLLRSGRPKHIRSLVGRFWETQTRYVGLRRDMEEPFDAPSAKIEITVRPLQPGDVDQLLSTDTADLPEDEAILRFWQRKIVEAQLPTCWVAVTADGVPCYMQWIIAHRDVERARAFYGRQFPEVNENEALLEGAFTPIEYRGQGIMPAAMALISEQAPALGARWVITYVADDNTPALKGCSRAGFSPYIARYREWKRFRRTFSISSLTEEAA